MNFLQFKKRICCSVPQHTRKGFTLIETLVAISVLMIAFTGPLAIATKSLSSAAYSKDQLAAIYLAQEGIEVIRGIRDNNAIAKTTWMSGLSSCFSTCAIDATSASVPVIPCATPSTCPVVKNDPATGLYGANSSWADTQFTRAVTLVPITANQVIVQSTVLWRRQITSQVTVKTILFNWH